MKVFKVLVILGCLGSVFAGGFSNCQPLESNFAAFENVWLNYIGNLITFAKNSSISYPYLAPAFIQEIVCDIQFSTTIIGDGTARLSGASLEDIGAVYAGTNSTPGLPLSCIATDLTYMRTFLETRLSEAMPQIQAAYSPPTTTPSQCTEYVTAVRNQIPQLLTLANGRAALATADYAAFSSIGMLDIYVQMFADATCINTVIGTGIGALFNSSPYAAIQYLNTGAGTLPYPFNCIQSQLDALRTASNSMKNSFTNNLPLNLMLN